MLVVATAASVVASQALISGVFSIMRQVGGQVMSSLVDGGCLCLQGTAVVHWSAGCLQLRIWLGSLHTVCMP